MCYAVVLANLLSSLSAVTTIHLIVITLTFVLEQTTAWEATKCAVEISVCALIILDVVAAIVLFQSDARRLNNFIHSGWGEVVLNTLICTATPIFLLWSCRSVLSPRSELEPTLWLVAALLWLRPILKLLKVRLEKGTAASCLRHYWPRLAKVVNEARAIPNPTWSDVRNLYCAVEAVSGFIDRCLSNEDMEVIDRWKFAYSVKSAVRDTPSWEIGLIAGVFDKEEELLRGKVLSQA